MQTLLKAAIELKHDEPLSGDDIDNLQYFMKDGIEQIIDCAQNFEVKRIAVEEAEDQQSQDALFTEIA